MSYWLESSWLESVQNFFKKPSNFNSLDKQSKKRGIDEEEDEGPAGGSAVDNVNEPVAANAELEGSGSQ